jgi:ABC-type lipoprotein release transport system permease subunit
LSASLVIRLAARNLTRNVRRTVISIIGVGVGCAIALFLWSFSGGAEEMRIRGVAESGIGHMAVVPAEWVETRDADLRLADWRAELAKVRVFDGVRAAAPSASGTALLAFGTRVVGVEMLGVDPAQEQEVNRVARAIGAGRYLEPGDGNAAVVGSGVLEQLDVELGDELFVTVVGTSGEIEYVMLEIVGVIDTGSKSLDSALCHITLEQFSAMTGLDGAARIAILLEDPLASDERASALEGELAEGNAVATWRTLVPAMGADAAADNVFNNTLVGTVILVVMLGVTSARLTAVLERKREFAVLMALGMRPAQLLRLIMLEAFAVGIAGSIAGLAIGTPLVYLLATRGIDFGDAFAGDMSIAGVLFDPVVYGDMGWWIVSVSFLVGVSATLAAAVYPTVSAMRTDPTSALTMREG